MSEDADNTPTLNAQKKHFESIHEEYVADYDDRFSSYYKEKIIYSYLAREINQKFPTPVRVLEIACGSGANLKALSNFLNSRNKYHGVDISQFAIDDFTKNHGANSGFCADFTGTDLRLPWNDFDVILVIGGVHHMVNHLEKVFLNIRCHLKPTGLAIFVEPNKLFMNRIRRWWYRRDHFFDDSNEEAISHDDLANSFSHILKPVSVRYFGGLGFFVILQSMILRVPPRLKLVLFKPLTIVDKVLTAALPKRLLPAFVAIWQAA